MLAAAFGFCLLGTFAFALGPALKLSKAAVIGDLKEQAGEVMHLALAMEVLPRNPLVVVQISFFPRASHGGGALHSRRRQGGERRDRFADGLELPLEADAACGLRPCTPCRICIASRNVCQRPAWNARIFFDGSLWDDLARQPVQRAE